jgi:single-stranded-DNA-specific exonuclease
MRGPVDARWRLAPQDPDRSRGLAAALGCGPIAAQILLNRGFSDPDQARAFLEANRRAPASPEMVDGMPAVIARLAQAAEAHEPVVVYGDYDADGVTATAILVRALRQTGAPVEFYIPDRRREGYGLHEAVVRRLAAGGTRLMVAVDCGITATAAARTARDLGLDLVILDHHLPGGRLPPALVIVNPHLGPAPDDYSAAGLALLAACGLLAARGMAADPDLVALAAIGTTADSVPLLRDNRVIVARGLDRLNDSAAPGLRALIRSAGLQVPLSARDVSFGLAPRLNAAGRLAHATDAVRLLITEDAAEAEHLAGRLEQLNAERRTLSARVLAEAVEEIEAEGLATHPAVVIAREGWHPGVVGIVASQIVDRYHRPAVLIALQGDEGRGSARSIPPLHLVETMADAAEPLTAYGGHAMAAGLTLPAGAVARFRDAFVQAVGVRLSAEDLVQVVDVDAEVALEGLTPALADELAALAPFGAGNPEPVLLTRGLRAAGTRTVGGGAHLRLVVSDGIHTAEAIGFRLGDRAELLAFTQASLDVAYGVERDRWRNGEGVQMVVREFWAPDVDVDAITADAAQVLSRLFERAGDYLGVRFAEIEEAGAFHTKVVGVTFEGRQALLPEVRAGDLLALQRDPANPCDPHAIKVCLPDGRQLGFLSAALAARLAPAIDAGARYVATATALTGGGDRAWGLNLLIERRPTWSGDDEGGGTPRPPSGEQFPGWAAARFARGRVLEGVHQEVLKVLMTGGRVAVRCGPGRGLPLLTTAAAAALLTRAGGPVVIVVPRAAEVDAWAAAVGPGLRSAGLTTLAVHGASPAPARARVQDALHRRSADVVITSIPWTLARAPEAGALVVVADDLCREDDLEQMRARFGPRIRLVTGPADTRRLAVVMGTRDVVPLATSFGPRTNLRIIDRRGRPAETVIESAKTGRPEKVLVLTAGAEPAVHHARQLREAGQDGSEKVAYYHDRLPATLRRVLEDLWAAGRITLLVSGSLMTTSAVPQDVTRVVALGIPRTRLIAAECLGAAGASGQTTAVELRYGATELAALAAAVEKRSPSRDSLVRCYHFLRTRHPGRGWTVPNVLPEAASEAPLSPEVLAAALAVFVEAGILSAEGDGPEMRYAWAEHGPRVDLERSLRFREAVAEQTALADLKAWATGPASAILADLARP